MSVHIGDGHWGLVSNPQVLSGGERMAGEYYRDRRMAELYDNLCEGRSDLAFYLPLMMEADSVLDIGCGTGHFLHQARKAGHRGRLCGVDPAESMLQVARSRTDIEWKHGVMTENSFDNEFSLAIMTGHAFQFLVTDAEIAQTFRAVYQALRPGGRFVFETRNPADRAWERWSDDYASSTLNAQGETVTVTHQLDSVEGEVVTFTEVFDSPAWDSPTRSQSTLRFLEAPQLADFIHSAHLSIDAQFGDFSGNQLRADSREIVTVASKPLDPSRHFCGCMLRKCRVQCKPEVPLAFGNAYVKVLVPLTENISDSGMRKWRSW